jgi:TonB-linked SusC/RagA family outer membrane protein
MIKGTGTTTVSDANGQFSINAPLGSTLVISSVGFQQREITANSSTIDEVLQTEANSLNEVVVIGYQAVRKRDLTGATSVINTQNTQRNVSRSLPEQLQGMAAGVAVRTGGAPGQEAVVNIRGLSTVFGNGNPLYVIDGMFSDPNTTVNPNDIESVQVLKDASAAAIYGSRAGNGVIIITTKKGREGPLRITASARYSSSTIPKTYDMMNGAEYVATNKLAYQNAGYQLQADVANYNGINTDWADLLIRRGSIQDYNVTVSGGSKNANILVSGSYLKDVGTLIARSFERTALRINSEVSRGRFKLTENLMISNSQRWSPQESTNAIPNFEVGNPWYDMFNNLPILPVQSSTFITPANPQGYSIGSANARTFSRNNVAIADLWNTSTNFFKVLGNVYLDFKIADFLSYRFNVGAETSLDHSKNVREVGIFYRDQAEKPSSVEETRGQFINTLFEHTLNFNHKVKDHSITGVVGLSSQTIRNENFSGSRTNLNIYNGSYFTSISSAGGAAGATGTEENTYISSYLGRLNYNFNEKYFASFTFRSDKSSLFSPKYRRGFFPSGALAWKISNEDFFSSDIISDLKLRASYGILGLAGLGRYQYTGYINQAPRAVFGSDQQEFLGATQARLVYENLKWERKGTTNIGIDLGLLNNQISVTLDAFRSKTEDVLLEQPLPSYLGNLGGNPVVNVGTIENRGIELEVGYRPQQSGDFRWNIAANVSVIRNEILALGALGVDPETGQPRNYIPAGNTRSQVGRSLGEYYVLKTDGIFQTQKEIDDHVAQSAYAKPGDIRYVNTVNGNTREDINDRDRQFAGSPWPKLTTGLQVNSSYKSFSLNIQLYGAFGQKIYNDVIRDLDAMGFSNYRRGLDYWTPGNTKTGTPRLGVSYATGVPGDPSVDRGILENARANSDRWIEDGSYLRLRNVELSYSFPRTLLNRFHLNDSRIYISGQNLVTFTGYSGLDPDIIGAGNINLEPGVDVGSYPSSRIITIGISVGF